MHHKNIYKADFLMLLAALVWGFTFVAQQKGMEFVGPFSYTSSRFFIASLFILALLFVMQKLFNQPINFNQGALKSGLILGVLLSGGINFQQFGLQWTTVTNSGFITGLYVLIVPFISLLFGKRLNIQTIIGVVLATIGMYLLTGGNLLALSRGDFFNLIGAIIWALHVFCSGIFAKNHNPILLAFLQFATCAVVSFCLMLIFAENNSMQDFNNAKNYILYGALVGAGVGFTLQLVAQKDADEVHAAIVLSLEAVFAAVAGFLLLDEKFGLIAYLGCLLMLLGMIISQIPSKK